MKNLLSGSYKGHTYRVKVACYPKTAELKLTLLPLDGNKELIVTQNIGQGLPIYQAFLADELLEVDNREFMDYIEKNGIGYIADYKRFDCDVFTGRPRRMAAVFQFDIPHLQKLDPQGCGQYIKHYYKLLHRQKSAVSLEQPVTTQPCSSF